MTTIKNAGPARVIITQVPGVGPPGASTPPGVGSGDLLSTNNLLDVANAAIALANLGGTTAAAAQAAAAALVDDLSGVTNAAVGRTNLGLGTAATQPSTAFDPAGAATSAVSTHVALADPHGDRAYTDAQISSFLSTAFDFKASARAATTADITLSGAQTIDGVAVVAGDRVLVKNQSIASQNGLYVAAAGAWTRSTDADADVEVTAGLSVPVEEGTVSGGRVYLLTTANPIVVGITALSFSLVDAGDLRASNNGSDFTNAAAVRTNLGLVIGTNVPAQTHAAQHKSAGSDAIKLDELAPPTDVTTLDASTTAHGLLPKLDSVATHYLDGTGAWSTPPGGGGATSMADGTVGAPGWPFTADTSTGLYRIGASNLGIAVGGALGFDVSAVRSLSTLPLGVGAWSASGNPGLYVAPSRTFAAAESSRILSVSGTTTYNTTAGATIQALHVAPTITGNANIATVYGLYFQPTMNPNVTITDAYGAFVNVNHGIGTVGTSTAVYAKVSESLGTTTLGIGVDVASANTAGTFTTMVGLRITALAGGSTIWGMQVGNYNSYHQGPIALGGTTAPTWNAHVQGGNAAKTALGIDISTTAPTVPGSNAAAAISVYSGSGGTNKYLLITFNDGGTTRYRYMNLNSTTATWTHATTLPT